MEQTYRSLYPFYDPPGDEAVDQLIVSSTGKLFGVTSIGELNSGYGSLYSTGINGGSLKPIYEFDFTTGSMPMAITLAGAGTGPELDVTIDNVAATNPGKISLRYNLRIDKLDCCNGYTKEQRPRQPGAEGTRK